MPGWATWNFRGQPWTVGIEEEVMLVSPVTWLPESRCADVLARASDHHTFPVHGHRWREGGAARDTRTVGPAESFRIRWREDAPGTWMYHCHVEEHMERGMIGIYRVSR